ncbi:MAG: Tn3 family transposase [Gammaproteobacteria bacterium]|nr:Tn3 family transposase [Gammaproteobacteria bacterium]
MTHPPNTSLECGHASTPVALKRLADYSPKSRFDRANCDLGRILKTEFVLQYMSETNLRRRIHYSRKHRRIAHSWATVALSWACISTKAMS